MRHCRILQRSGFCSQHSPTISPKSNPLVRLVPCDVVYAVLGVEPAFSNPATDNRLLIMPPIQHQQTYHFTTFSPPGPNCRTCTRPLPISPKFAPEPTAIRSSKKGEKARAWCANDGVLTRSTGDCILCADFWLLIGFDGSSSSIPTPCDSHVEVSALYAPLDAVKGQYGGYERMDV